MSYTKDTLPSTLDGLELGQALWIDGKPTQGSNSPFDVVDPSTGEPIAQVANGSAVDARAAVDSAEAAFADWAATAPRARAEILRRTFELMIANAERMAAIMSWENGKSLSDARAEVAYAAEFFRWFSEEAVRSEGDFTSSPAGGTRTIVTHRPIGVAALVTPWNFPAAMATRKIAPALAAGCTVVLKPAHETPITAIYLMHLMREAGVPDGVVNLVPTSDSSSVVSAWLEDERVRMISFTGSTQVGRLLLRQAAERVVNSSMELGGNAPFIVMDDADVDAAVDGAMVAKLRNGGQACTAANRLYVHADVAEEFTRKLGERVAALTVGSPFDEGVQIGPVVSKKALDEISSLVERAVSGGAQVAYQAKAPQGTAGYFFPPTVLTGVSPSDEIVQEEMFGPIAPIVVWNDEEQLLGMVNDTEYGLSSYLYSRDLKRAIKFAERIEAGMVGINRGLVSDPAAPFGGMKQSGIGREGAREGVREFQETQYFSVDWS
jgi:succinate-semialdehyde dehydrogenase/glutarate-semialdehyde dehydrogenase